MFQLHPNAWRFASGHIPKLELLPRDADGGFAGPYGRSSNGQGAITVSDLELRLPTIEDAGALGGLIKAPAAKVLRSGDSLAADFAALTPKNATIPGGKLKGKAASVGVKIGSPEEWNACHATVKLFLGGGAVSSGKGKRLLLGKGKGTIPGGRTRSVKVKLSGKARRKLAGRRKAKVRVVVTTTEQSGSVQSTRTLLLPRAK